MNRFVKKNENYAQHTRVHLTVNGSILRHSYTVSSEEKKRLTIHTFFLLSVSSLFHFLIVSILYI
jgi:hypothetical protein